MASSPTHETAFRLHRQRCTGGAQSGAGRRADVTALLLASNPLVGGVAGIEFANPVTEGYGEEEVLLTDHTRTAAGELSSVRFTPRAAAGTRGTSASPSL